MLSYKKMYFKLFNSLTNAIEEINNNNYGKAKDIMINAQIEAEEEYISSGEEKNG